MPFGLKNGGATYQRAMVSLCHDMMHKEIEVYVKDMITKFKPGEDHVLVLRKLFERLKKYNLKLNSTKNIFEARSGKLLRFMVNHQGIEIDPSNIKAIREIKTPMTVKEVRSLLGRLNYIARLTDMTKPFFKLLKKDAKVKWDAECHQASRRLRSTSSNHQFWYLPL